MCVYAYSKFPVSGARSAVFLAYARCLWVTWAMLRGDLRVFGAGAAGPTVLHANPEGWRIRNALARFLVHAFDDSA